MTHSAVPPAASALAALSDQIADLVAEAARPLVVVAARDGVPATGIHWRPGLVVTADHVLHHEEEATLTTADGTRLGAVLAGRDPSTDIAVFRLDTPDALPTALPGAGASLRPGHFVLALGLREGHGPTASLGIVQAVGGAWRSLRGGVIDQSLRFDLDLPLDAEGGPIVDTAGRVIGLSTVGPRRRALAIPAATIDRVGGQLLEKGRIGRGYLGLGMQPARLADRLVAALGLASPAGVVVVAVEPDGPAAAAGVLVGDVLVAVGAQPVADSRDVLNLLGPESVGTPLTLRLIRGGEVRELAITVGEQSAEPEGMGFVHRHARRGMRKLSRRVGR